MLDRRSFFTAALGAATLPMPALAAPQTRVVTLDRVTLSDPGFFPNLACPTAIPLSGGQYLAAWTEEVPFGLGTRREAFLARLTADLRLTAPPRRLGPATGQMGLDLRYYGGGVVFGGPDARVLELDGAGLPLSGQRSLSSGNGPYILSDPVVAVNEPYYVTAWAAKRTDGTAAGVRLAWVHRGGSRLGNFLWTGGYTHEPAASAEVCGLFFDHEAGTTLISQFRSATSAFFVWRHRDRRGNLGKPIVFGHRNLARTDVPQASFAVVAPGRIAGVWGDGDRILGGLFLADGTRLVDFEPLPTPLGSVPDLAPSANALMRLGENGIFSALGSAVYDARTGKVVARPSWYAGDTITKLIPLGGHRFAATSTSFYGIHLRIFGIRPV